MDTTANRATMLAMTTNELAAKLNLTSATIAVRAKKLGILRSGREWNLTLEEALRVEQYFADAPSGRRKYRKGIFAALRAAAGKTGT